MRRQYLFLLIALLVALTSCSSVVELTQPEVVINSPASGSQLQMGQDVTIQSTSNSKQGIARVELVVDGQVIRTDTPPVKGQSQFSVVQTWKATAPGSHAVIVRATNDRGATGEAGINVLVSQLAASPGATTAAGPAATTAATGAAPQSNTPAATKAGAPAATPLPTVNAGAPTPVPVAPATTQPTSLPLGRPTPTPITSDTKYTVVITEDQIKTLLNSSIGAAERTFIGTTSVSLQNGQISANATYQGPGGQTVNGTLILAVSASNCDLKVTVIQATIGPAGMTDARKAAISANMERLLAQTLAQYRDYRCVESVTIADGKMTIVYY